MIPSRLIPIVSRLLPSAVLRMYGAHDERSRWARAVLIRRRADALRDVLALADSPVTVQCSRDMIAAGGDGVFLDCTGTDRYFKITGDMPVNEAAPIADMLRQPRVIVDVGANYGELALYLARRFPDATVYAVEPSTQNRAILERNLAASDVANVRILPYALSDHPGIVHFPIGRAASDNRMTDHGEAVRAVTLAELLDMTSTPDFLKIDIEGAEARLGDALRACAHRLHLVEIEFHDAGMPSADVLPMLGFDAIDRAGRPAATPLVGNVLFRHPSSAALAVS